MTHHRIIKSDRSIAHAIVILKSLHTNTSLQLHQQLTKHKLTSKYANNPAFNAKAILDAAIENN